MTNKLQELYQAHVMMGMRKQRYLASLLGEHSWEYDKSTGSLAFPPGPTYQVQVLGTEAADSDTWLWAWANDQSEIPAPQLEAALRLKSIGEESGIEEFTTPRLPREQLPVHLLAPVALGLLDLPAYYRGALEGMNLLCVISDPAYGDIPPLKATEFVTTLGDAISNCLIPNHRMAIAQFLDQLGWKPHWAGPAFEVQADDGIMVLARFDELNRLCKLSTRAPQPA